VKELLTRLKEIGEKSEYLNQKSQSLVKQNRALQARIAALEKQLQNKDTEISTLAEQYEIVKLARNMDGDGDERTEKIKDKINEYIREIDQCLKLIGD
jgi:predicted RNase H-like nuclease (RuvC/YqgF family)